MPSDINYAPSAETLNFIAGCPHTVQRSIIGNLSLLYIIRLVSQTANPLHHPSFTDHHNREVLVVERIIDDEQHHVGRREREVDDADWQTVVCSSPSVLSQNHPQGPEHLPQHFDERTQDEVLREPHPDVLAGKTIIE